jgi:hypothetical protein
VRNTRCAMVERYHPPQIIRRVDCRLAYMLTARQSMATFAAAASAKYSSLGPDANRMLGCAAYLQPLLLTAQSWSAEKNEVGGKRCRRQSVEG